MKTRDQIADELMRGVPEESRADHTAIANMLVRGLSTQQILNSVEVDRWPETYIWLKNELEVEE